MRKIFALTAAVLVLSSFVLGCGCDNGAADNKDITDMPVISPVISALPSPDTENGIVNDGDGFIEDNSQDNGGSGSASEKKSDIEEDVILQPQPSENPGR